MPLNPKHEENRAVKPQNRLAYPSRVPDERDAGSLASNDLEAAPEGSMSSAPLDGVASDHRALLSTLQNRAEWSRLSGQMQLRFERLVLAAEDPTAGILTTRSLEETGERIGLSRDQVKRLLGAGREAGLVRSHPEQAAAANSGRIKGPSTWSVNSEPTAQRAPNVTAQRAPNVAPNVAPTVDHDAMHAGSTPSNASIDIQKACIERAEQNVALIEQRLGVLIAGPNRQLVIECLIEDEQGVYACYMDARERARNPIGLLITMLKAGEHRGRVYTAPLARCSQCGRERVDVRDRRQEIFDRQGVELPSETLMCDFCTESVADPRTRPSSAR